MQETALERNVRITTQVLFVKRELGARQYVYVNCEAFFSNELDILM